MNIGYALRSSVRDAPGEEYLGGTIAVDDARDFDVAAALESGGGTITVDDSDVALVTALDHHYAVERVSVPKGADGDASAARAERLYGEQSATELRADARSRGLTGAASASKADLVPALELHDELLSRIDDEPTLVIPQNVADLAAAAATGDEPTDPAPAAADTDTPKGV